MINILRVPLSAVRSPPPPEGLHIKGIQRPAEINVPCVCRRAARWATHFTGEVEQENGLLNNLPAPHNFLQSTV